MLDLFHIINVKLSQKNRFLQSHIEKFAEHSSAESDEQGESFHQMILVQWQKLHYLFGDICWNLQEEKQGQPITLLKVFLLMASPE